jgi:putative protease
MAETEIGEVFDFFSRVSVIALKLKAPLKIGDTIHIVGHTSDFTQKVESMQTDNEPIKEAKKGGDVGIKVVSPARRGDKVFLVK